MPIKLRASSQDEPGITRRRRGRGFSYFDTDGALIKCEAVLARVKGLGLPPAYTDVWICRDERGHLQAAGTDARERRQYRYHADWRAFQNLQKFQRLEDFGRTLPRLRAQVTRDLRRQRPDRAQVSAALIRLIDTAALRVGSDRYAQTNGSYGATTLLSRHLKMNGPRLALSFQAKGGRRVRKQIKDRTLARVLERVDELPGRKIFTCIGDDGQSYSVLPSDVNAYIAQASGDDRFTAKTFRTWHGSLSALNVACDAESALTIKQMSEAAAARLHNTQAIARSSYIHPHIIDLAGLSDEARRAKLDAVDLRRAPNDMARDEKRLISFLSAQNAAK